MALVFKLFLEIWVLEESRRGERMVMCFSLVSWGPWRARRLAVRLASNGELHRELKNRGGP